MSLYIIVIATLSNLEWYVTLGYLFCMALFAVSLTFRLDSDVVDVFIKQPPLIPYVNGPIYVG